MKDYGWKIKVSDLLNNPGTSDIVEFNNKFLKKINDIKCPGISGKISIQGISNNEILVKILTLTFSINYICDKCLKEYTKKFNIILNEEIRFVNTDIYPIKEKIYDNIFPINIKNKTIDLEPLIEIFVKIQEPIIKDCGKHKNQEKITIGNFQEKNNEGLITFGNLLKSLKK